MEICKVSLSHAGLNSSCYKVSNSCVHSLHGLCLYNRSLWSFWLSVGHLQSTAYDNRRVLVVVNLVDMPLDSLELVVIYLFGNFLSFHVHCSTIIVGKVLLEMILELWFIIIIEFTP